MTLYTIIAVDLITDAVTGVLFWSDSTIKCGRIMTGFLSYISIYNKEKGLIM